MKDKIADDKYNTFLLKHDPKGYEASYPEPPCLISAKKC